MDLNEFVARAAATDNIDDHDEAVIIGLMGIAGEAGTVISETKKWFRDDTPVQGVTQILTEEIGDLLWYIALVARRLQIDLNGLFGNEGGVGGRLGGAVIHQK